MFEYSMFVWVSCNIRNATWEDLWWWDYLLHSAWNIHRGLRNLDPLSIFKFKLVVFNYWRIGNNTHLHWERRWSLEIYQWFLDFNRFSQPNNLFHGLYDAFTYEAILFLLENLVLPYLETLLCQNIFHFMSEFEIARV